ncbi:MAG: metallophosphoesterase, partial [Clostridia bacterium]|nr:metallophosphoesterase [Clostridia bacterium]
MKKRLISFVLCLTVLMMSFVVSVGAVSPAAPSGVTSTKTVSAAALPYTVSYGTTDGKTVSALTAYDAQTLAALQAGCDGVTTDSVTGIPCQVYEIDASGTTAETVVVALHAATVQNERMALKVFNPATAAWDTLDTAVTSGYLSADVARATYADASGKIKAMVTPDYVTNGSNRFIWSTDQQHYAEFEDLNATYYAIHEYMVKEYQNGTAAYVINTGDIVDDTPHMATAKAQWTVADKAFAILDKGNVPYGIASGNHDVGDYPMNNYTHYLNHFNASRYENNPWYGGTRDDNKSHYDLVTVGNVDFIILYFGYGQGDQMELLDWANS